MKFFKLFMSLTTSTLLATSAISAEATTEKTEVPEAEPLKVLSVGNSFSANDHKFLTQIAKSMGKELVLRNAFIGGCSLEKHARHMKEYEQDPKKGNVYHGGSLIKLLQLEDWDIVTIQQVSHESFKPETYEPYASEIIERIKKYAPNAEIVVHQTWGYNKNNGRLKGWGMTPEEMAAQVIDTYQKFAAGKSFRYIPAGELFAEANKTPLSIQSHGYPATIYARDGFHASKHGEYFLGCIWYNFLFKEPVSETAFKPDDVNEQDGKFLRELANTKTLK
ncbi:MAG: DUF4886 domain-containing protein [Kiritimatiellae bacterium]|nr:DUF4886 domain-containing protein [Kiritimatiellia bacterium]